MNIGVISLGCDKNRVDTEKMLSRLTEAGHTLTSREEEADVIVINTCAFTEEAKKESIDEILAAIKAKREDARTVVTGCLPERYLEALEEEFPEVDAFLGVADYDNIVEILDKIGKGDKIYCRGGGDAYRSGRILTTPRHYAYLKIADGCDNRCTYCAIPSIRGKYRSESVDDLIAEAGALAADGVKELILVAQDVTRYGCDFDGKPHLIELIDRLSQLDVEWIRLMYLEPEMVDDALIAYIANNPKVCNYMDIPLQHIDDEVLKRMNRRTTGEYARRLVAKAKAAGIAVRTSFISGFPGESEEAHQALRDYIFEAEIDYAGVFEYSREEGTPADRLKGHLPKRVRHARAEELRAAETDVIARLNQKAVGNTYRVIYEGIDYDRQMFFGRSQYQAPEIDSAIYFTANEQVQIGNFYDVEITSVQGLDLIGRIK